MGHDVVPLHGRRAGDDGRSTARGSDRPRLSPGRCRLPVRRPCVDRWSAGARNPSPSNGPTAARHPSRAVRRSSSRLHPILRFRDTGPRRSARSAQPVTNRCTGCARPAWRVATTPFSACWSMPTCCWGWRVRCRWTSLDAYACFVNWRPRSTCSTSTTSPAPLLTFGGRCRRRSDLTARAGAHRVVAVGHAHIDSAWLWPIRETQRKCARTFASAIRLMDDYPDYHFTCSQAAQYDWIERSYPTRVRRHPRQGRRRTVASRSAACGSSPT